MILDHQHAAARYVPLHPGLATALDWLGRESWLELSEGRHALDGDRLVAIVARETGRGEQAARLEYHQRYIDVQVALEGEDLIGWSARGACSQEAQTYDAERDVGFFADRPSLWFPLRPGHFAIFFPEDAHAPLAGSGTVRKLVLKIAVS